MIYDGILHTSNFQRRSLKEVKGGISFCLIAGEERGGGGGGGGGRNQKPYVKHLKRTQEAVR